MKRHRGTKARRRPPLVVLLVAALAAAVAVVLRRRASGDGQRWLDGDYRVEPLGPPEPVQVRSEPATVQRTDQEHEPAPDTGGAAGDGVTELLSLSRQELYARAQALDIPGRSRMSKRELAEAVAAEEQR